MIDGTDMTSDRVYQRDCVEALKLRLAGLEYKDIGKEQGCSQSAAHSRVAHAIKQLTANEQSRSYE